jgi:large subunit ribosomal protein L35
MNQVAEEGEYNEQKLLLSGVEKKMPKHKTNRGAAKRFSKTGSGRIKRKKAFLRHILTSKTAKNKRNLRQHGIIEAVDEGHIKKMLPFL